MAVARAGSAVGRARHSLRRPADLHSNGPDAAVAQLQIPTVSLQRCMLCAGERSLFLKENISLRLERSCPAERISRGLRLRAHESRLPFAQNGSRA